MLEEERAESAAADSARVASEAVCAQRRAPALCAACATTALRPGRRSGSRSCRGAARRAATGTRRGRRTSHRAAVLVVADVDGDEAGTCRAGALAGLDDRCTVSGRLTDVERDDDDLRVAERVRDARREAGEEHDLRLRRVPPACSVGVDGRLRRCRDGWSARCPSRRGRPSGRPSGARRRRRARRGRSSPARGIRLVVAAMVFTELLSAASCETFTAGSRGRATAVARFSAPAACNERGARFPAPLGRASGTGTAPGRCRPPSTTSPPGPVNSEPSCCRPRCSSVVALVDRPDGRRDLQAGVDRCRARGRVMPTYVPLSA